MDGLTLDTILDYLLIICGVLGFGAIGIFNILLCIYLYKDTIKTNKISYESKG